MSILIAMAVYYPFAKAAERQRLNAERTAERGADV
jgi:cellobiose-specific phosphotransferase system component IIC